MEDGRFSFFSYKKVNSAFYCDHVLKMIYCQITVINGQATTLCSSRMMCHQTDWKIWWPSGDKCSWLHQAFI